MILVVDDKESVRSIVRAVLERQGHQVLLANDGEEATSLWQAKKESIDLLFTDVVLPRGITGMDLAERLRGDRPSLKVVFCSGYGSDVIGGDVIDLPGNYFLAKPFDISRLTSVVAGALAEGKSQANSQANNGK